MLVQKHREYLKYPEDGCFSVGKSEEEIFADLKNYAKNNLDYSIYYFVHPVRPNKENHRPEYMMEIERCDNGDDRLMLFWTKYQ